MFWEDIVSVPVSEATFLRGMLSSMQRGVQMGLGGSYGEPRVSTGGFSETLLFCKIVKIAGKYVYFEISGNV